MNQNVEVVGFLVWVTCNYI